MRQMHKTHLLNRAIAEADELDRPLDLSRRICSSATEAADLCVSAAFGEFTRASTYSKLDLPAVRNRSACFDSLIPTPTLSTVTRLFAQGEAAPTGWWARSRQPWMDVKESAVPAECAALVAAADVACAQDGYRKHRPGDFSQGVMKAAIKSLGRTVHFRVRLPFQELASHAAAAYDAGE
jgi:hypothetical protein